MNNPVVPNDNKYTIEAIMLKEAVGLPRGIDRSAYTSEQLELSTKATILDNQLITAGVDFQTRKLILIKSLGK